MELYVIIGVILAIVGAGYAWNIWNEKKRADLWQQVADELGIEFRSDGSDLLGRCGSMKLFTIGRRQRLLNVLSADTGELRITLGDLRYVTGSGKHQQTHHETVCILEADDLELPHCFLRPQRRLFDAIGSMFGKQDIDFAEDPAFSAAYVLQGESELAIRELFDADVRAWFCERGGRRFRFEARRNVFVFHTGDRRKPIEATDLMQQALEIRELMAKSPSAEMNSAEMV